MIFLPFVVAAGQAPKPAMRDFIGLNVHTTQFRPELYRPVTSEVRDYHAIDWDVGDDPKNPTIFPNSRNGVNWLDLYGAWKKDGYRIDVTAQDIGMAPSKWTTDEEFAYGESFAKSLGPSGPLRLVDSIEIGNEPANFSETEYRAFFETMAKGIRKGDPKLKIATCAVAIGKADKYSKDIACLSGLESYIDIVNVHTYPFVEGYPTWRRSYPEDPKINYLKQAQLMIDWRNQHDPGRPVWVTEFGYDATTKPNKTTGDFAKWMSSTDEEQATYIVRSYLVFSAMDIAKAFLFYFNDSDEAQLHGSSGLTRNFQPKPSFYAVAHLQKTLGNYRFDKALAQKEGEIYLYQYRNVEHPKSVIWAAWSPTGSHRTVEVHLQRPPGKLEHAERMPLREGEAELVPYTVESDGTVSLTIGEQPVYLWIKG